MIEATHLPHRIVWPSHHSRPTRISIIGCGGTGSILADTLCRLLTGTPAEILLIDPDIIEHHNLMRQNFHASEVGQPKSKALALRLSSQYQRSISYSVNDCRELLNSTYAAHWDLTITCVDNALARAAVHELTHDHHWVMDTGNGRDEGQVLLGSLSQDAHRHWYYTRNNNEAYFQQGRCLALPAPATQQPELLIPQAEVDHPDHDCAQAVLLSEQGPLINQAVALTAAQLIYQLLTARCRTMAVYLDTARGNINAVPASPANAARYLDVPNPHHLME